MVYSVLIQILNADAMQWHWEIIHEIFAREAGSVPDLFLTKVLPK